MSWKKTRWQFRYYAQYFPFTINTVICVLAAYLGYRLLYTPASEYDPEPFRPFIMLMGKLVFWFIMALVAASVLSTIISWLYYLWLRGKKDSKLQLSFATAGKKKERF